ncbi:MAG: magnesium transporter [Rhodopirellula sp.]|nr:magnesium transporter [Rhodopirellula sp.]
MINTLHLAEDDAAGLLEFCTALHPARTADFMEGLTAQEAWAVLQHADAAARAEIFNYLTPAAQSEIVRVIDRKDAREFLSNLPPDDRVDLLQDLQPSLAEELVSELPAEDRRDVRRLQAHPRDSAGAMMTTAFARLREGLTVRRALEEIARQLLSAMRRPDTPVRDLVEREVVTVDVLDDQETVARKVARFDFPATPWSTTSITSWASSRTTTSSTWWWKKRRKTHTAWAVSCRSPKTSWKPASSPSGGNGRAGSPVSSWPSCSPSPPWPALKTPLPPSWH